MRPITDSEIGAVFDLFAQRWRRVPVSAEVDL
jgi:hypothetical protein